MESPRYGIAAIELSEALPDGGLLLSIDDIDAAAASFNFAGKFGKFFLVLAGPRLYLLKYLSGARAHDGNITH